MEDEGCRDASNENHESFPFLVVYRGERCYRYRYYVLHMVDSYRARGTVVPGSDSKNCTHSYIPVGERHVVHFYSSVFSKIVLCDNQTTPRLVLLVPSHPSNPTKNIASQ